MPESSAQAPQAISGRCSGLDTAPTSPPAAHGIDRSKPVAHSMKARMPANRRGRRIHCRQTNASTSRFDRVRRRAPPSISSSSLIGVLAGAT